jgi:hypothetical protein
MIIIFLCCSAAASGLQPAAAAYYTSALLPQHVAHLMLAAGQQQVHHSNHSWLNICGFWVIFVTTWCCWQQQLGLCVATVPTLAKVQTPWTSTTDAPSVLSATC